MTAFIIASTFTESLAKLAGEEQKAVKTTAFELQIDPSSPGMQFHRIERAKDRNFWSVRVNRDLRLIVHRMAGSLLLCYVAHHDNAYAWAERRKVATHPTTGAAQIVEVRERVEEVTIPVFVHRETPVKAKPALYAGRSDKELLTFGVPPEWLADVRAANEDTILDIASHLPQEAAEALLNLAVGIEPAGSSFPMPQSRISEDARALLDATTESTRHASVLPEPMLSAMYDAVDRRPDPFAHPDAQRRFRVITDVEELTRALDAPWDRWTIFLHPAQRALVERRFNGPARVSGSAGTGKTVVALHRTVHAARSSDNARVLLATFSPSLANVLRTGVRRLLGSDPRVADRIDVSTLDDLALRLLSRGKASARQPTAVVATEADIRALIAEARAASDATKFTDAFLFAEWSHVVDPWRIVTWEEYRDVPRLGRRTRLPELGRAALWSIFERVREGLARRELTTMAEVYELASASIAAMRHPPFSHVVVDEAQDLSVPQLRFVAALGGHRTDALFFAGDLGQRIFQSPFSWRSLGVDIRGRSSVLRINYRTSHQIRAQADKLLDERVSDVDGDDERRDAISIFNGPPPMIAALADQEEEARIVGAWLAARAADGVARGEIGVFVRSDAQLDRARAAVDGAGLAWRVMGDDLNTHADAVTIGVMQLAKGLEFRTVAVMACDDEVIPLQSRIESVTDQSELEEVYRTERHLLYVAFTRARDHLLISAVKPTSEFLDDLVS